MTGLLLAHCLIAQPQAPAQKNIIRITACALPYLKHPIRFRSPQRTAGLTADMIERRLYKSVYLRTGARSYE
jgi:hypothetical protein